MFLTDHATHRLLCDIRTKCLDHDIVTEYQWNEFVGGIALWVRQMVDSKVDDLRSSVSQDGDTVWKARQECIGMSKGQLIESLLYDELSSERF